MTRLVIILGTVLLISGCSRELTYKCYVTETVVVNKDRNSIKVYQGDNKSYARVIQRSGEGPYSIHFDDPKDKTRAYWFYQKKNTLTALDLPYRVDECNKK
tara:strand:+ start:137 stop:439 length:303 start_codon:yes stop_codon:yes gene_type:complete